MPTHLPGVLILEPTVFADERGWFFESWNARTFCDAIGEDVTFVQDNHCCSWRNVLRGIHYQVVHPQGKLVRATSGTVLDVAVDLRRSSPEFRKWVAVELSAENRKMMWIPPGFGHAFLVRTAQAEVQYKVSAPWSPPHERCLRWDDAMVGIDWDLGGQVPILSPRDRAAPTLVDAESYA